MVRGEERVIVHFDEKGGYVYKLQERMLTKLDERRITVGETECLDVFFEKIDVFLKGLNAFSKSVDNQYVRLYVTGLFHRLNRTERIKLINAVFINHGLYCNIVPPDLEEFYLKNSGVEKNIVRGLVYQMFRSVVVCGSFQQSLGYIEGVISLLRKNNVEILSPRSTKVRPETLGSNFILFDYQEDLKNERDTWRYKYEHMEKFKQADAVVVCNPGGSIGKGTMFEFGCLATIPKRTILTEQPTNLSVFFPYEVGLDICNGGE